MESNLTLSISIPFTCGVACAAAAVHWGIPAAAMGCAGSLACCTLFILAILLRTCDRPVLFGLLACTGIFCYSTAWLGSPATPDLGISTSSGPVCHLRSLISSIPFRSETTVPLLNALMTGDRSGLSRDMLEMFRRSGASHMLALSGLHLGVLAGFMNFILMILGRSKTAEAVRGLAVIALSAFYTLICGASPSLVRALLFITFSTFSRLFPQRHPEHGGILCTAITVQLAFNPLCITSLAFQMSYLAVAGIAFIHPVLEGWYPSDGRLGKHDPMRKIWSMMALGISCQLTTAPLAWLRFHSVPTFFLLTNLLAMPLCELLMVLGAATLLLCSITGMQMAPEGIPGAMIFLVDKVADLMLEVLSVISSL